MGAKGDSGDNPAVTIWLSDHPFLRLLLIDVIGATLGLMLLATFVVYCALSLMPRESQPRGSRGRPATASPQNEFAELVERDTLTLWAREGDFRFIRPLFAKFIEQDVKLLSANGVLDPINADADTRVGYVDWLAHAVRGDLGGSAQGGRIWGDELSKQLPVTIPLCLSAYLLSAAVGILLALIRAARNENRLVSAVFYAVLVVGSLPAFLLGYAILGARLTTLDPGLGFPILVLAFSGGVLTETSLIVSQAMNREMAEDYINTARVKGLNPRAILPFPGTVARHAFRQAATNFLPQLARRAPQVVGMGLVVETVFGLKGLSIMLLDGLANRQDERVLAAVLVAVLLVQCCNWLTLAWQFRLAHGR